MLISPINSALNPASSNSDRLSPYPDYTLKTENINTPTPISQIPKLEKQNNIAINVYGYTITKTEKINIFPYYISEEPNEMQELTCS